MWRGVRFTWAGAEVATGRNHNDECVLGFSGPSGEVRYTEGRINERLVPRRFAAWRPVKLSPDLKCGDHVLHRRVVVAAGEIRARATGYPAEVSRPPHRPRFLCRQSIAYVCGSLVNGPRSSQTFRERSDRAAVSKLSRSLSRLDAQRLRRQVCELAPRRSGPRPQDPQEARQQQFSSGRSSAGTTGTVGVVASQLVSRRSGGGQLAGQWGSGGCDARARPLHGPALAWRAPAKSPAHPHLAKPRTVSNSRPNKHQPPARHQR